MKRESNVLAPLNVVWLSWNCCLQTFEDFDLFNLIGIICGLAIYNLTIVELQFPVALYKKLLKRKPTLDDLKELMPDVGRSGKGANNLGLHLMYCVSFSDSIFSNYGTCVSSDSRSLQLLLDYTEDDIEETFCLNFSVKRSNFIWFIRCKAFCC